MANFGALGTLRNAYRTLNKPSTSALLPSIYATAQVARQRSHTSSHRAHQGPLGLAWGLLLCLIVCLFPGRLLLR